MWLDVSAFNALDISLNNMGGAGKNRGSFGRKFLTLDSRFVLKLVVALDALDKGASG